MTTDVPGCPYCRAEMIEALRGGWAFCACCAKSFQVDGRPAGEPRHGSTSLVAGRAAVSNSPIPRILS
jgi:hypothetical protein